MISAGAMREELKNEGWYSLGYLKYPQYEYVKDIRSITGSLTRGVLKANIDENREMVRSYPDYKMKFSQEDCCAMLYMAHEFMEIAKKYGYSAEWAVFEE